MSIGGMRQAVGREEPAMKAKSSSLLSATISAAFSHFQAAPAHAAALSQHYTGVAS